MSKVVMAKLAQLIGAVMLFGTSGLALAQGDAEAGEGKITTCVACHGTSGNESALPDVPMIGGQNAKYILKQLMDVKSGAREIPVMTGMVMPLSDQDMADIAAWYAAQEAPQGAADPEVVALGETLYRAGDAEVGVAACTACHNPSGMGNNGAGYPALAGQDVDYTIAQLNAFRSGSRNNDDGSVMRTLSKRLTDAEIKAVASYVSGLRP